jgi:hypothetical protein
VIATSKEKNAPGSHARATPAAAKKTLAPGLLWPPAVVAAPFPSNGIEGEDNAPPLFFFAQRGRAGGSRKGSALRPIQRGGMMAAAVERWIGDGSAARGLEVV